MKNLINFSMITLLIGFMLAIQFNTIQNPQIKDNRDLWELREDYLEAKEIETKLLQEIRLNEEKLAQYETDRAQSAESVLLDTIKELRYEAGKTEMSGPGIVITLYPAKEFIVPGLTETYLAPDVLRKLINELNMSGAKAISIADQRIVSTTAIREIQGETKVDGYPLRKFPIEIKVITKDMESANKLYNRMQISNIPDDFIIDNISVKISSPKEQIVISPYQNEYQTSIMKQVLEEGGM